MTLPNLITLSRIFLIPVFVALYYFQPAYTHTPIFTWINFCLTDAYAFISITDYLDGYLARKLNMTSQLGAFLDPVADKLMVSTALIMLVDFLPFRHPLVYHHCRAGYYCARDFGICFARMDGHNWSTFNH